MTREDAPRASASPLFGRMRGFLPRTSVAAAHTDQGTALNPEPAARSKAGPATAHPRCHLQPQVLATTVVVI